MMILGEPVIASVLALLLLGETPPELHVAGAAFVLLGLGLYIRSTQHS